MVDPYEWLGVPKNQRPPTHYQLLGIGHMADEAAVEAAALLQLARLEKHRHGPHAASAVRLAAEIAEARDTLADFERRQLYDILAPDPDEPAPPPPLPPSAYLDDQPPPPSAKEPWWEDAAPEESPLADGAWWKEPPPPEPIAPPPPLPRPVPHASTSAAEPARPPRRLPVPVIAGGVALLLILATGGAYLLRKKEPSPSGDVAAAKPEPEPVAPEVRRPGPAVEPKPVEKPKDPLLLPPPPPPPAVKEPKAAPPPAKDEFGPRKLRGHLSAVVGVAAGTGGRAFSMGDDKALRLWSGNDSTVLHTFLSPGIGVAAFDGGHRVAACDGLTVTLFDVRKPGEKKSLDSPRGGVRSLAVSADGRTVVTGLSDGFLRAWKVETATFDEWQVLGKGAISAVAMTPDGRIVAAGDGSLTVWQLAGQKKLSTLTPHKGGTFSLNLAGDGNLLATGGADGTAAVYDLAARKEVARFAGHGGPVTGVAWLPDGKHLATTSTDGTARLWSLETGRAVRWLQQLDGKGECIAVDAEGKFAYVGNVAGAVWRVPLPGRKEAVAAPAVQPPAEPLPVPSALARRLALEQLLADPSPPNERADAFLARGQSADVAPALRYALLVEARRLAAADDDPNLAVRAAIAFGDWFDVDNLGELAAAFKMVEKTNQPATLAESALDAIERAELAQRPEMASWFLRHVRSLPNLPQGIARGLTAAATRLETAATEATRIRTATATLKANPDEPEANYDYGMFLCAGRQHWDLGLPRLARCSDAGLKELARADLKSPPDAAGQLRLAEGWYARATAAEDSRTRRAFAARARHWLGRVIAAKADGADAVKAKSRLDAVAKLEAAPADATTPPPLTPSVIRRGYESVEPLVRPREWVMEGDTLAGVDGVRLGGGDPVLRSLFDLVPGSRIVFTVAPDGRDVRIICAGQDVTIPVAGMKVRLVVSFTGEELRLQASADGGLSAERVIPVPPAARGPGPIVVRLVGEAKDPVGTLISSAVVRGPVMPAVPKPE